LTRGKTALRRQKKKAAWLAARYFAQKKKNQFA